MKKLTTQRILGLGLLVLFAHAAGAQWVRTNDSALTGWSNTTALLAVSDGNGGNLIFSGKEGGSGVLVTADNGATWTAAGSGLTGNGIYVYSLAVSGANLFAGTLGGVFLSTNNGTSWTAVNTGLTGAALQIKTLAVVGSGPGGNLFAGTAGGVYRTPDNGATWILANTGIGGAGRYVQTLAVSGGSLFAGTNNGGVFLTVDNGTNWTAHNTGLNATDVRSLAVSGANLFAGSNRGVYRITIGGPSGWAAVNTGLTDTSVQSLAVSGGLLFAGTNNIGRVFVSPNDGATWIAFSTGLTATDIRSLARGSDYIFAGSYRGGVWRYALDGTATSYGPRLEMSAPVAGAQAHAYSLAGRRMAVTPGAARSVWLAVTRRATRVVAKTIAAAGK